MENRLLPQQLLRYLVAVACFVSFSTFIKAQNFTLDYSGPDTLFVGDDCSTTLDWDNENTVSFTAQSGAAIDTFYITNISAGFQIGDEIRAPRPIFVSYFVEDELGNSQNLQSVLRIVIADSIKPVFDLSTLPRDTAYERIDDVPLRQSNSTIGVSDNCGIESIRYLGESDRPTTCGSFTRTWAALDTARNETRYVQTITIGIGTNPPQWTNPPTPFTIACDFSIDLETELNNWLNRNGNTSATSNTDITYTHDFEGLNGCGATGMTNVTFTATDECGNASTIVGNITVTDSIAPVINPEANDTSVIFNNDPISLEDWLVTRGGAMASDFCTVIDNSDTSSHWMVTNIDTTAACGNNADYAVTFVVMDDCGNADTTAATFSVIDTIGPNLQGLIRDTFEFCETTNKGQKLEQWFLRVRGLDLVDSGGNDLTFLRVDFTGRDGFSGTWSSNAVSFDGSFIPEHDCTWFADAAFIFRDVCGKEGVDSARFFLRDTIRPELVNIPVDTTVACGEVPSVDITVSATDNCDTSLVIAVTETSDTTTSAITITRTWTATDDCGNSRAESQLITVIDTIAPVLAETPADTIVACDNVPETPLFLLATDNCTPEEAILFDFVERSNQLDHPDSCQTYQYTITRIWKAIDAFNNVDSAVQVITVIDTIRPTFTTPMDVTVSCELQDDLSITGQPTDLMDNCVTLPDFSFTDLVIGGDCIGSGTLDTIIRTWTVTDACGNISQNTQQIILIDTTAPIITGLITDITVQCNGDAIPLPTIGTDITATDNCGEPLLQYVGETNTQSTDANSCDFYNYSITRTWRATDRCGNSDEFVQNITIIDTIAPTIICPADVTVTTGENDCGGDVALPRPLFFDDCTGITGTDSFALSQNFTHPMGTDANETPVDTIIFSFDISSTTPEKTIASDLTLTINLNGVDGEGANEIFSIIGEDRTVFAGTNPSAAQCGSSTTTIAIPTAKANEYAQDSVITFRLAPNGSGTEAINNICQGGNATVILQYDFEAPTESIDISYKINGGAPLSLTNNPTSTFASGEHTITYLATDCSGNVDSCSLSITIEDQVPPTFDCPANIIAYASSETDEGACTASVLLPFPTNIADNCGAFNNYDQTIAEFLTFQSNANAGLVPNEVIDTFSIDSPNAIADGTLTVSFVGDNADAGEFFTIFGENGEVLGTTNLGDSITECSATVTTTFSLNKDTINAWAADGQIIIRAVPNVDAGSFSDFINPCDTTLTAAQSDGKSTLSIGLNFPAVIVNYVIADTADKVFKTGMLPSPNVAVMDDFSVGINRVTYTIEDAEENASACLFVVEVRDTTAPVLVCRNNFTVLTNPSGDSTDLNLLIDSLITSLSDNCGIDSVTVTPSKISCTDDGTMTVTITAVDHAGNTVACQSVINIGTESIEPTFSVGICNNDALFLFADTTFLTPTSANTTFTYAWSGPNNFTSTEANPIIPNVGTENAGIYNLTMTGPTGCSITGTVFVNISSVDAPIINTVSPTVCQNEGITLTTSAANCDDLEYQWYEIVERATPLQDTIMLAGTSTIPSFSIENPRIGNHAYYLVIKCADCSSLGSEVVNITVFEVPTAITDTSVINICEGESIALSSPLTDQTFTYSWVGPNFSSSLATPAVIENATEVNEGVYTFTVSKDGCTSEEAFTVVSVSSKPEQPTIVNESGAIVCEASPLVLRTNATNGNSYIWTNTATFTTITTTAPELIIDSVATSDSGSWTVSVATANCPSEPSNSIVISVEAQLAGTPFFSGAACEGSDFELNVNPIVAGAGYEWMDAASNNYQGANPTVPVSENYTLRITSVNGCVVTRVLPIDVKTTPVITALFDSGDADPCIVPDDTDIRLIADVFPANDGSYTYTWTVADGTTMAPNPDSILLIPNTSSTDVNGTYSLVVNTADGCQSAPATTIVEVTDIPVPNPVIAANSSGLCEGQTLTLTATEYPNFAAEYRWQITSIMDTVTQSPVLVLDSVTTALNGTVSLQVFNGNCPSIGTATLPINVSTPLAQPAIIAPTQFCTGTAIRLTTTEVEGANYLWEGTNFTATSSTPEIIITNEASLQNNGGYTVKILANGCTSPKSEPIEVAVVETLAAPSASNSGDICLDNATDIILFIDQDETPAGIDYRWYNAETDELVAGPNNFKSQIIEVGNLAAGTYSFYATQSVNGCESARSNITEVTLANIPTELAQLCDGDMTICEPDNASICALPPTQGTGTWTTDNPNVIIENPNEPETGLSGLIPGTTYTFFWRLSNGVCGEYSATRLIVEVGITGSVASVCEKLVEECEGNTVNLCANPLPSGFAGQWSQPSSQAALGVTIDDATASNTTVSTTEAGTPFNAYTFYWTVTDAEALCTTTDTMSVNVYGIPSEIAMIDDTELISCNGEAVVSAQPLSDGLTGQWSSLESEVTFETPTNPVTNVSDLNRGMNTLTWSLTLGACTDFSSDEMLVFYEDSPVAEDDVYDIGFSGSAILNVTENDQLFSPEFNIKIVSGLMNGVAEITDDGQINYLADQNFVGEDVFIYEVCNSTCVNDCSTAQVTLKIGDDANCDVPSIMTPNQDGVNDEFFVPCIETGNYPGNEVIIFNQWGDEIYRAAPYQNDWKGTYNGEDIPAGTYYYVIAFDRNTEPKAGFIIIER
ncbi:MAG: gliding motility-associated C-terminal domain-containing protein [Bacteroidota bacterium]